MALKRHTSRVANFFLSAVYRLNKHIVKTVPELYSYLLREHRSIAR